LHQIGYKYLPEWHCEIQENEREKKIEYKLSSNDDPDSYYYYTHQTELLDDIDIYRSANKPHNQERD
jgi:hypothetical protein